MWIGRLGYIVGWLLLFLAAAHLPPLLMALADPDPQVAGAFVLSAGAAAFVGGALILSFRVARARRDRRVLFLIPLAGWGGLPLFACLPFLITGHMTSLLDAYFEATSALTTTGATLLPLLDPVPPSLVLWRAVLSWLGGLGTVVAAVALFQVLNVGGLQLIQNRLPHGEGGGVLERMRGAAVPLLQVYVFISLLCGLMLWATGLEPFDALVLALSTPSTGGFVPRDGALAAYATPLAQGVLIAFMALGAINMTYHWSLLRGRPPGYWRDTEVRYFAALVAMGTLFLWIGGIVDRPGGDLADGLGSSLFVAVSALSTTGITPSPTADGVLLYPLVVLSLVFIGGATASTAGGLRLLRMIVLLRHANSELHRLAHPHSVSRIRVNGKPAQTGDLRAIWLYGSGVLVVLTVGALVLTALEVPFRTATATALAALATAGPAAMIIDPTFGGYWTLDAVSLAVLCPLMVIGRIEVAILLAVFWRAFWRS